MIITGQITEIDGRTGAIVVTDEDEATFEMTGLSLEQVQEFAPLLFGRVTITITGDAANG